jgi:hypothetical protein
MWLSAPQNGQGGIDSILADLPGSSITGQPPADHAGEMGA